MSNHNTDTDTDDWSGVPTQQAAQLAAFTIGLVAFVVVAFVGAPSASYTIPAMLVAVALYVGTITRKN